MQWRRHVQLKVFSVTPWPEKKKTSKKKIFLQSFLYLLCISNTLKLKKKKYIYIYIYICSTFKQKKEEESQKEKFVTEPSPQQLGKPNKL